jgi:hypothetical protein
MHGARPDRSGVLKLGGHSQQELIAATLLDRRGQFEQQGLFFCGQDERHRGASVKGDLARTLHLAAA